MRSFNVIVVLSLCAVLVTCAADGYPEATDSTTTTETTDTTTLTESTDTTPTTEITDATPHNESTNTTTTTETTDETTTTESTDETTSTETTDETTTTETSDTITTTETTDEDTTTEAGKHSAISPESEVQTAESSKTAVIVCSVLGVGGVVAGVGYFLYKRHIANSFALPTHS